MAQNYENEYYLSSEFDAARLVANPTYDFDPRARFVMHLIERWAMVQGKPNGEDSAGRAKIDLMPVDELIDRAFNIANKAFEKIESEGWVKNIPDLKDMPEWPIKSFIRNRKE